MTDIKNKFIGVQYEYLMHLRELTKNGLTPQAILDFHIHLKKFSNANDLAFIFEDLFSNFSKENFYNKVLLPSYSHILNATPSSTTHYAPFKFYVSKFKPTEQEQIDILNICPPDHQKTLIKEIIHYHDTHLAFYDYLKKRPDFYPVFLRKVFEFENNVEYLDFFKDDIKQGMINNKIHIGDANKFFKVTKLDKVDYFLDNLLINKDAILGMINIAFVSMPWKNIHSQAINHTLIRLLKKDRQENILDIDAFLLMTKRMIHCGWSNKLPALFQHIQKHHDFFDKFKEIVLSNQKITLNCHKKYNIDFNNSDIQSSMKNYFICYLEKELAFKDFQKTKRKI